MKITHNKIGQNLNLTDSSKSGKTSEKGKAEEVKNSSQTSAASVLSDLGAGAESTKVEVSDRAKDIRQIKELASASPDVDAAKVEKFRRLIDEGKYKVDAKAIAEKMVDEHLMSGGTSNE